MPRCTEKHFNEFTRVWNNTKDTTPQPVTLLITLIDTAEEASDLCIRWKLSNVEKDLAIFIVTNRNLSVPENAPLKPYEDLVVSLSTKKTVDITRKKVQELLNYEGKLEESEAIRNWTVPIFPVTGNDLKQCGIKPGHDFGRVLNKLKEVWMESFFTYPKEYLIGEINDIYDKIRKK